MLEIFLVIYLLLGLLATLLLWMALAVSSMHRENDQQRHYQIALAVSNLNARGEYELPRDHSSFEESEFLSLSQRVETQEHL